MIELPRNQIAYIRSVIRQALGVTSHGLKPVITLQAGPEGLRVSAASAHVAVEHRIAGAHAPQSFAVPYEAFKACEGRQADRASLERVGQTVRVRWMEAGIPQSVDFDTVEPAKIPPLPTFQPVDARFLPAMADACATTEADSTRYALHCVRLRGSDGQIAATDGRQALIQTGFEFPWDDEVLVPACGVFTRKEFQQAHSVAIGRSDDWLTIRADDWTVWLRIEKNARFPAVDQQIPETSSARTTLDLSEDDAVFLDQAARRLPGAGERNSPVTLDLNGAVVVRAKSGEQSSVTDLVLRNSRRQGEELKVSSNREYVRRAIQLGFREIHFRDADAPAFCRDDRRTYFWAVLGKQAVLKSDASATRIESSSVGRAARVAMTKPVASPSHQSPIPDPIRNRFHMTTPSTNRIQQSTTDSAAANGKTLSALIEEGEQLRATLREVLSRTSALVVGLKRQRQQSNAMRTALKSLRAMQTIEV